MKKWICTKYQLKMKNWVIFFVAFMLSMGLTACGKGVQGTPFEVKKISLWSEKVLGKSFLNFSQPLEERILVVEVKNCEDFDVRYTIGDNTDKGKSKNGRASLERVNLPVGKHDMTISLSAKGMKDYTYTITVNFKLEDAKVDVLLKKQEDAKFFSVGNGAVYLTNANEAEVEVKSETAIKKAIVAGKKIDLSEGATSFTTTVGLGDVDVLVFFEKLNDFGVKFELKQNEGGGLLPMNLSSAKLYTGNALGRKDEGEAIEHNLFVEFDENGVMRSPLDIENVEYSIVRLEMEFDAPIKEAKIKKCEDARSDTYATDPTKDDFEGIFSGRVAAKTDPEHPGKEIPLSNVDPKNPNKYTELLIVGNKDVSYTIEFSADGRKTATYVIKLNNLLKEKMAGSSDTGGVCVNRYTSVGLLATWPSWRWFGYTRQPVSLGEKAGKDEVARYRKEGQGQPEYMGDIVGMAFAMQEHYLKKSTLMFLYHRFDNRETEECHDFVLTEGERSPSQPLQVVMGMFDPQEKHVDAFVSFKTLLPWGVLPYSLQNKWKKVVNKGFLLKIARKEEITNTFQPENPKAKPVTETKSARDKFKQIFGYRMQAKTFGNADESKRTLKMNYIQKYQDFVTGAERTLKYGCLTGDVSSNAKRDIFVMQPLFDLSEMSSFRYEIRREGSSGSAVEDFKTYEYKAMPVGSEAFIIGGDDSTTYTEKLPTITNYDKIFMFNKTGTDSKPNKYNIDVTVTMKAGNTEVFKMVVDYSDEESGVLEQMNYGEDVGVENQICFGMPFN